MPESLQENLTPEVEPDIDTSTLQTISRGAGDVALPNPEVSIDKVMVFGVVKDGQGFERATLASQTDGIRLVFKGPADTPDFDDEHTKSIVINPPYDKADTTVDNYVTTYGGRPLAYSSLESTADAMAGIKNLAKKSEVSLIVDESAPGLAVAFRALSELGHKEFSEDALTIMSGVSPDTSSGRYEDPETEEQIEYNAAIDSLELDLVLAASSQSSPDKAFQLVLKKHLGGASERIEAEEQLSEIMQDRLARDIGVPEGVEPHELSERLQNFSEIMGRENVQWVHRDLGLIRPKGTKGGNGKVYAVSKYKKDVPRQTVHGSVDAVLDIEASIYGGGNHGIGTEQATIIVAPLAELSRRNQKLPNNYEESDTYFTTDETGLELPDDTIYVTVSGESQPEDKQPNELWLPSQIDMNNPAHEEVINEIASQIESSPELSVIIPELLETRVTVPKDVAEGLARLIPRDVDPKDAAYKLQVRLANMLIKHKTGRQLAQFEAYGRGLDFEAVGGTEAIKRGVELAEAVGLSYQRHPGSMQNVRENQAYEGEQVVKELLETPPNERRYSKIARAIESLPLARAAKLFRDSKFSFDQIGNPIDDVWL